MRDVVTSQIFCKLFHAALCLPAVPDSQVVHSQSEGDSRLHHFCGSKIASVLKPSPALPRFRAMFTLWQHLHLAHARGHGTPDDSRRDRDAIRQ